MDEHDNDHNIDEELFLRDEALYVIKQSLGASKLPIGLYIANKFANESSLKNVDTKKNLTIDIDGFPEHSLPVLLDIIKEALVKFPKNYEKTIKNFKIEANEKRFYAGKLTPYSNKIDISYPQDIENKDLARRILHHELVHSGLFILSTHKHERFTEIIRSTADIFKEHPELLYLNHDSSKYIHDHLVSPFYIHPAFDEAMTIIITDGLIGIDSLSANVNSRYLAVFKKNTDKIENITNMFRSSLDELISERKMKHGSSENI